MVRSLKQYLRYYALSWADPARRKFLLEEKRKTGRSKPWRQEVVDDRVRDRNVGIREGLGKALQWLCTAQDRMDDDGIGSFHLVEGWGSSYPETTGYIIPTLLEQSRRSGNTELEERASRAADWLLSIQKPEGGWQGSRMEDDQPPVVFNTGQVIRGMLAMHDHTGEQQYLDAAVKAGDWLCALQEAEGCWKKNTFQGMVRVYDSYVDVPLLELTGRTGDDKYRDHACRNLDWIVEHKQTTNGWFRDCDNTRRHNDAPILHTLAYTMDGLLDAGVMLNEPRYLEAARKPANLLMDRFFQRQYLNGRYDSRWHGREAPITTGLAQMAIIWGKLYRGSGERLYLKALRDMNKLLLFIQHREYDLGGDTEGALQGSFPLWGRYEKFAFPNWATKYFVDSLVLEEELNNS